MADLNQKPAVVLMAYGSPRDESEVEAYYTHIRHGRPPSPEALQDLLDRYRAIGFSPLDRITRAQAKALSERAAIPAYVGYKHTAPFIAEAALEAAGDGVDGLIGIPLAPHYAGMSLGTYERELREAWTGRLLFVSGFHDHPAFIGAVCGLLREALRDFQPDRLFFTAHSLPARILAEGDPYRDQLLASCELVAEAMPLPPWEFAFQRASHTGEPWLGPDLLEVLETARESGAGRVLVCPIGFVAEHLEILYDIDLEAAGFAREHGLELRRTAAFDDRPEFIALLAALVEEARADLFV
ncbi:MAG TPA: ferrochelatase [Candidatus Dormibacteraeota bacterium]